MDTLALEQLKTLVAHPSVSTDPGAVDGMRGAREWLIGLLRDLDFSVEVIDTPKHPIILAERPGPNPENSPHVLVYGHYDVQPADPLDQWKTPPFQPEVRDGRLFGRGAADNKGPIITHIAALRRVLEKQPALPLRITYLIEGEEEIGSPSFAGFLEARRGRLAAADLCLVSDTGIPNTDTLAITTGLRGLVDLHVELTGPSHDLHSGVHGGAILNPIQALTELCASLHDRDGRVALPGFYDAVLPVEAWEREEMARYPTSEEAYRAFLGVKAFYPPKGFGPLEAVRLQPTLEFNGIGGGYQGAGSKTIIPSKAFVKITCRLVPDQSAAAVDRLLRKTLEERCPPQVSLRFSSQGAGEPYRVVPPDRPNTPTDQPAALAAAFRTAEAATEKQFGQRPLYLREGGSVPIIGEIRRVCGVDSVMLGLFDPETRPHAPNESFDLGVMEKGIAVFADIFAGIANKAGG
ncbi:MAG: M20/M25/M40 family metallo-hydrolase [Opitutales bacterium]